MKEEQIYKNRWTILGIVVMLTFMATLDSSIVNVALPEMAQKLNTTMGSIEWVVTIYLITIVGSILFFGRLGDMVGKPKVFLSGLGVFTIGSLLCGVATSLPSLLVARVIQAIGASASMATNQGIITHVFPASERGRALGTVGTFVALGTLIGPPLGGFIIHFFEWNYIFLINIPVGVVTVILGMKLLPKGTKIEGQKIDILGTALLFVGIVSFFYTLSRGSVIGYGNRTVIGAFVVALVTLPLFYYVQIKSKSPLLDLSLFKNSLFTVSIICAFLSFVTIGANIIIQPFYLQKVLGFSPGIAGIYMMIYPIILAVVAPLSGYLSDKTGSEGLTMFGLLGMFIGFLGMAMIKADTSIYYYIGSLSIMSLGNGMFQSPNNSIVMSQAPKPKLGVVGSVNALVRNIGLVLGVSLATSLLYGLMSYKVGYSVDNYISGRNDVFLYGMRGVYGMVAVVCFVAFLITALRLYKIRKSTKEVTNS